MPLILNNIIKTLDQLNNNFINKIVTYEKLNEEYQNIEELKKLDTHIQEILNKLQNDTFSSPENTTDNVCLLHMHLLTYVWHIEQVQELTENFIGLYKEKSSLTNLNVEP